jgi:ABC-2 type transport system permease protein
MTADAVHLAGRSLRAFARQPYYIVATLVQPVIWLVLFGQLFQGVIRLPGFEGVDYVAYLTPGIVVMTAIFSCGWSGMGYVDDMRRGVLDRFLTTRATRSGILLGSLTFQAVMTLIQSAIILALGIATGARFGGGVAIFAVFAVCVVALGSAIAAFSNAIALLARSEESVIATSTLIVLPLTFMSSTFLPASLAPDWIGEVARFNPANWAVVVGRETLRADVDWGLVASRAGLLVAFAAVCALLSTRAFGAYQRSL